MPLEKFIVDKIAEISGADSSDSKKISIEAEWVIPSVLFGIDPSLAKKMVINEDLASSKGYSTGVDFISFDDNPIPTMVQVKTGSESLDYKKVLEDSKKLYDFLSKEDAKKINDVYGIDETLAAQIKSRVETNGYLVAFISAAKGKITSSQDVMVYNGKDIKSAFHKNSIKYFQGNVRTKNVLISNKKDSAIVHSNNSAIDFHITLSELITLFSDDNFDSIFEYNVRAEESGFGKRVQGVKKAIKKTLTHSPERFVNLNNGITVVADSFKFQTLPGNHEKRYIQMKNPSIVNGQQTFRQIKKYKDESIDEKWKNATILIRLKEVKTNSEKNEISEATNKMIKVPDINLLASKGIFADLFDKLLGIGIFLEGKYRLKDAKSVDLKPISLEVLFGTKAIQLEGIKTFSNIKTQIYEDFFDGKYPKLMDYFKNPNLKEIEDIYKILESFKSVLSSKPLQIFYTAKYLSIIGNTRYKNLSMLGEKISTKKTEFMKVEESFKKTGPRKTTSKDHLSNSWDEIKTIIEKLMPGKV